MIFQSSCKNNYESILATLFIWVTSSAENPLNLFPSYTWVLLLLPYDRHRDGPTVGLGRLLAGGGDMEGRGSRRGPARTRWAAWLGPRRGVQCRPLACTGRRQLLRRRGAAAVGGAAGGGWWRRCEPENAMTRLAQAKAARSSGSEWARKSAMAAARARLWQSARKSESKCVGGVGSAWGSLGFHNGVAGARQEGMDARHGGGARCSAWTPRRHIVEHVVRVEVDRAGVGLGWLQTELATGPKTKFEAHAKLYVFH
jgi:hypothetical protein